jgi:hypothetical protein
LGDGPIGIQQSLCHLIQGGASAGDQVIAKLGLGEKQAMLAASLFSLPFGEEGRACGQSFLPAVRHIAGCQRIGQLL